MILLDSSFLIAYHNTRDMHHAAAARTMVHLAAGEWGQALLLEYVFLEVVSVLRARLDLDRAERVGNTLLEAAEVSFVPCSDLFVDAFEIFTRRRANDLSFVDAAIVAAARRDNVRHVATFDNDFRGLKGLIVVPA